MKMRMAPLIGLAGLMVCNSVNYAASVQPPQSPLLFTALQADLESRCAEGSFSGVVLVRQYGNEIYEHACSPDRTPNADELYKIFSMSKTFTGTAILSLVEDGRLDLNAPLSRYLPNSPAGWSGVTLMHLLHHNSGIPDHTNALFDQFTEEGVATHAAAMDSLLASLTDVGQAVPGGDFAYSNFGYELLAHIAAKREGKPFDRILRERIFDPAGMTASQVDIPVAGSGEMPGSIAVPNLVQGYNGEPGALEEAQSYSFVQLGAGSIFSSARDLGRFAQAMNEGRIVEPAIVLNSEKNALSIREAVSYGAGVIIRNANGCKVLQHSGGTNGFVSDLNRIPSLDASVVVLSNYGFSDVRAISGLAVQALTKDKGCDARPT